jgi:hypothetical protein
MIITWVDEIQNGETHGRVKLIDSTPFCLKQVWIGFYWFSNHVGRASLSQLLRGHERASPSVSNDTVVKQLNCQPNQEKKTVTTYSWVYGKTLQMTLRNTTDLYSVRLTDEYMC